MRDHLLLLLPNGINQLAETCPIDQLDRFSVREFLRFTSVNTGCHENRAVGARSHEIIL